MFSNAISLRAFKISDAAATILVSQAEVTSKRYSIHHRDLFLFRQSLRLTCISPDQELVTNRFQKFDSASAEDQGTEIFILRLPTSSSVSPPFVDRPAICNKTLSSTSFISLIISVLCYVKQSAPSLDPTLKVVCDGFK